MGRARVERCRQEFRRTGIVTVRAGILKGVAATAGMMLMALLAAGMSVAAFHDAGATSLRGWGTALAALFALAGVAVCAGPVLRRRQLTLTRFGLAVAARHRGRRVDELVERWEEIRNVELYRSTDGETTSTDVRIHFMPGVRTSTPSSMDPGYRNLPSGFAMSKKDLAALMEGMRISQAAQR